MPRRALLRSHPRRPKVGGDSRTLAPPVDAVRAYTLEAPHAAVLAVADRGKHPRHVCLHHPSSDIGDRYVDALLHAFCGVGCAVLDGPYRLNVTVDRDESKIEPGA